MYRGWRLGCLPVDLQGERLLGMALTEEAAAGDKRARTDLFKEKLL